MNCDLDLLATWIVTDDDDNVRDHVATCAACSRESDALRDLEERLEHLSPIVPASARRPAWPLLAAGLLLAIAIGILLSPAIDFSPAAQDPIKVEFEEIPKLFREMAESTNPTDAALRERIALFRRRLDALQRRTKGNEQIPVLRKACTVVEMMYTDATRIATFKPHFNDAEWKEIETAFSTDHPSPAQIVSLVEAWLDRARAALRKLDVPAATLADVAKALRAEPSFRVRFEAAVKIGDDDPLLTRGETTWFASGALYTRFTQSGGVERLAIRTGGKTWVYHEVAEEWVSTAESGGDPTEGIADPGPILDALARLTAKADGERFTAALSGADLMRFAVDGAKVIWPDSSATLVVDAPFERITSISIKGVLAGARKASIEASLTIEEVGIAKKPVFKVRGREIPLKDE